MRKTFEIAALMFATVSLGTFAFREANALTFTASENGEVITAEGIIEDNDGAKLRSLVTTEYLAFHGLIRFGATLFFNSPGGSVQGGVELAHAIRERSLMTNVPADAICYSACTIAFLGGTKRTVLGQFGIHRMSLRSAPSSVSLETANKRIYGDEHIESIQRWSGTLVNTAQQLVGDARLITAMFKIPSSDMSIVPDNLLSEWRVVTVASRPTQRMRTSFNCNLSRLSKVELIVCDNLSIADADRRMAEAYDWLIQRNVVKTLKQDQDRWRAYRNSCKDELGPNGDMDVWRCVRDAYQVRTKQLEGLKNFYEASAMSPASENWRPNPPIEEQSKELKESR